MSSVAVIVGATIVAGAVVAHDRTVKQNRRIGEMQAEAQRREEAQEQAAREEIDKDEAKRREFRRTLNPSRGNLAGLDDEESNFNNAANPSEVSRRQRQNQSSGRNRLLGS